MARNTPMLRWILLVLALFIAAAASLTTVRAPTLGAWKAAVFVGEFGYLVIFLPIVVAVLACVLKSAGPVRWVALALAVAAIGFLLKPLVQATGIARALPATLTQAFGPVKLDRAPLEYGRLLDAPPLPAENVRTFSYARAGATDELRLDFHEARRPDGRPVPCVIAIHGGGWDGGERSQLPDLYRWLASRGFAVATIDYRLAPAHIWPAQREDVLAALAWLRAHATELGIDGTRLVLFGRSAGGQIAEAVSYTANDPAIRGVVAFYAPADLNFAWANSHEGDMLDPLRLLRQLLGGTPETARAAFDDASGYRHVTKSSPPTLLVHGALDTLVWHRQSERLATRLAGQGVSQALVSLPWATHAFDFNLDGPGGQLATFALEWFLTAVTK